MTPDLESLLRADLEHRSAERAKGHTLERVVNELLDVRQRVGRLERWREHIHRWKDRLARAGVRDPMPSIGGADDSGSSIEVRGLGMGLKASGTWPVRVALALLATAFVVGCVMVARR